MFIGDVAAALLRGGRCAYCGSIDGLQIDHVRPLHANGPNVPMNWAVLCGACNKVKSCYWPGHGYHARPGVANEDTAKRILLAELWQLRDVYGVRAVSWDLDIRPGLFPWPGEWAVGLASTWPDDFDQPARDAAANLFRWTGAYGGDGPA